jgi:hypothetical protein
LSKRIFQQFDLTIFLIAQFGDWKLATKLFKQQIFFWDNDQKFSIARSMMEIKPPLIKSLKFFGQWSKIFLGNDRKL